MIEEISNNDITSQSIDNLSHRQNKNLEIIIEERASLKTNPNNIESTENKTQYNFNKTPNPLDDLEQHKRSNSCEKRKKNKILEKKMKEIMDYRKKFKTLELEEKLEEEEMKKEENEEKKKVEKKVNRNLKLLNIIKETMNQNEIKENNKNENKDDIINNTEKQKENLIEMDNKENKDEKNFEKNQENKIDEDKKNILMKLFDKKSNNEKEDNKTENNNNNQIKEKEQNIESNKGKQKNVDMNNKYQKNRIPHPNAGSVSYPTFMKKGTGNFHISTPKSKFQGKKNMSNSYSKARELDNNLNIQNINNDTDDKFNEVPIEPKYKLTITIDPKKTLENSDNSNKSSNQNSNIKEKKEQENKITSLSNKKEEKQISNDSSAKKGAMKILELLKARKKEQKENEKYNQNKEVEENEPIIDNKKTGEKKIIKKEKLNEGIFDTKALDKKKFKEEIEEEKDLEINNNYNKTLNIFKKANKKMNIDENNNEKNFNNNNNNSSRIKTNYFNNINNNINNYFNLGGAQDIPERKTLEYFNKANILRNKYHKKLKGFNSTNHLIGEGSDEDNDDIFRISNNSHINYLTNQNSIIDKNNSNLKNLDKSYDIFRAKKTPIPKREINKKNILSNINEPKKITNVNPRKIVSYRPYERKAENNFERSDKVYNKLSYKRKGPTYVKKSPGKINAFNSIETTHKQIKTNINNNIKLTQNRFYKSNINNPNKNNIGNKEGVEISTIYGINTSIDSSISNQTTNKNSKFSENPKENTMLFNLEDLLVLEERLNNITFALESNKNVESQCFNFWNYYFNCSLSKILEKLFQNEEDAKIIRLSTNYQLMSIMVCYDFSFGNNVEDEDLNLSLIELIYFNHNNLIIICEYILTKISQENNDNIWVVKLQEIVKNSKTSQTKDIKNTSPTSPIQKITNNTNKIMKKIKSILLNYQSDSSSLLKNYILNLPSKTYSEINSFFRSHILRITNYEGSLVPPSFFKKNQEFKPMPAPYLKFPSNKPYTLILDLDETLVSFQIKSKKEGTLRARPFLFAFLEEMGHYYELIVWTSATESYANSLIEAIEYDKQYFDFILFREHAIIIGDEFVKDLTRVGRGLDRIIILDDMPQNFRLQKQNGITIKPFFGDDYNDTALYDLLPILKHIAEEGNDVRIELAKYRNEIVKKITSNISFNDI